MLLIGSSAGEKLFIIFPDDVLHRYRVDEGRVARHRRERRDPVLGNWFLTSICHDNQPRSRCPYAEKQFPQLPLLASECYDDS